MKLSALLENLSNLRRIARENGLSDDDLSGLDVIQKLGSRTMIAESIKLTLVKDETGNFKVLKESYGTPEDLIASKMSRTKFI